MTRLVSRNYNNGKASYPVLSDSWRSTPRSQAGTRWVPREGINMKANWYNSRKRAEGLLQHALSRLHLVAIVAQRFGPFDGGFASGSHAFGDPLSLEGRLGTGCAQREGCDTAKHNPCVCNCVAFHGDHGGHAHQRKVECLTLFQLDKRASGARSRCGDLHSHHHLSGAEGGLFEYVLTGPCVELFDGDHPVALGNGNLHPRIERRKSRSHVGRADHITVLATKDGVILILSAGCIAVVAPFAEAVFKCLPPEVPAARPLAKVTAECTDIADLGNGYLAGGLRKKRIFIENERRDSDVAYGGGRTDLHAVLFVPDIIQLLDLFDVDHVQGSVKLGSFHPVLHHRKHIAAACKKGRLVAVLGQQRNRLGYRAHLIIVKALHKFLLLPLSLTLLYSIENRPDVDRYLAEPHAHCIIDGIGDSRSRNSIRWFAHPFGAEGSKRVVRFHDNRLNNRHVEDRRYFEIDHIGIRTDARLPVYVLSFQHAEAYAHHSPALDLVFTADTADRPAHIVGCDQLQDLNLSRPCINSYLGKMGPETVRSSIYRGPGSATAYDRAGCPRKDLFVRKGLTPLALHKNLCVPDFQVFLFLFQ